MLYFIASYFLLSENQPETLYNGEQQFCEEHILVQKPGLSCSAPGLAIPRSEMLNVRWEAGLISYPTRQSLTLALKTES